MTLLNGQRAVSEETRDYRKGGDRLIRFVPVTPGAVPPMRARKGDAGFDLFACADSEVPVGGWRRIDTGISVRFPRGWFGLIAERSSQGAAGLFTAGNVIDEGYTGAVSVVLFNLSDGTVKIRRGEKVAQLLIVPRFVGKDERTLPERFGGAFGSTGNGGA